MTLHMDDRININCDQGGYCNQSTEFLVAGQNKNLEDSNISINIQNNRIKQLNYSFIQIIFLFNLRMTLKIEFIVAMTS